jgi:hypothetical protein
VVCSAAEIDWIDEERGGPGWSDEVTAWCVGPEAALRARERGWVNVQELPTEIGDDELVAAIAELQAVSG